jgi:hypothetical protein
MVYLGANRYQLSNGKIIHILDLKNEIEEFLDSQYKDDLVKILELDLEKVFPKEIENIKEKCKENLNNDISDDIWNEGYNAGYDDGYHQGFDEGYNTGYNEAYEIKDCE